MRRIVDFCLQNTFAVVLTFAFLLGFGAFTAARMNQEEMPAVDIPYVAVVTAYPGSTPEDVDANVTAPLESALRQVRGVKNVYSTSVANLSVVELEFDINSDVAADEAAVKEAVDRVRLPENAQKPQVSHFNFSDVPVLELALQPAPGESMDAFQAWVRDTLIPQVRAVPGVGDVTALADLDASVDVRLDEEKLAAHGLTAQAVVQMLQAANLALPAGATERDGTQLNVRVDGGLRSLGDLAELRIPVLPQQDEVLRRSLDPLIEGIQSMGRAMGRMGQELAHLGQGVGAVEAQVQLMNAKQDLAVQLMQDRAQLAAAQDAAQRAALQKRVAQEERTLAQLDAELKALQASLPAAGGGSGAGAPGGAGSGAGQGGIPGAAGAGAAGGAGGAAQPAELDTVRLGDIATITLGAAPPTVATRLDGRPALLLQVYKETGANAATAAEGALAQVEELSRGGHPFRVTVTKNAADSVRRSVGGMEREAFLGAVFAALVIYLFLRRGRATLVAVLSIPTSVAIGLLLIDRFGVTLNVMSLAGMAVAVGRVVDDAIVVTENIHRHARTRGYSVPVILEATAEVASAITASTLTTVAVFAPLGLVGGIVGRVFRPFALTVVFALLASLFVAVTLVPALTLILNRGVPPEAAADAPSRFVRAYRAALDWLLSHRAVPTAAALALLVAAALVGSHLGTAFLPADEHPQVTVRAVFPEGTPLATMDREVRRAEEVLLRRAGVTRVVSVVGAVSGTNPFLNAQRPNDATLMVDLAPGADPNAVAAAVQKETAPLMPDARVQAAAYSAVTGGTNSIQLVFSGPDEEALRGLAARVEERLQSLPGLTNVSDTLRKQSDTVVVRVDSAAAARYGLTTAQVLQAVHAALSGYDAGTIRIGGHAYPLEVHLAHTPDLEGLRRLTLHGTQDVSLGEIASVSVQPQPTAINRRNQEPFVMITGDITAEDVGSVTAAVAREVAAVRLPPGVSAQDVGVTATMREGFTQMAEAMVAAIVVVYMIMLLTFGEGLAPLAILFSLPFAAVGAVFALALAGYTFSIPPMIGMLMLNGIVVTNAIVLMDRFQQQRRLGLGVREALLEAAGTRLRPILMTALATMFALLPLALGFSEGSLISSTLAVVVIGGLSTSTLLTLVVVPMAYENLRWLAAWPGRVWARARGG
ncbi:MAG: efflux RND transporter permease subunit, partial [Firmicutes bacterium]|nr:efflux RND transporter permease subunit [Bacillota bacterium]